MNHADENYKSFTRAYQGKNFAKAGRLAFEILSLLPGHKKSISDIWVHKLAHLFEFLNETYFEFKSEDDFYEMLSTISTKIKSNPDIEWKAILT